MAGALVETAPGILFFASIVEADTEDSGTCCAMFLCVVEFAIEPGQSRGVMFGLDTALEFVGHATGTVRPALGLPLALECGHALRRCMPGPVTAAPMHGGAIPGARDRPGVRDPGNEGLGRFAVRVRKRDSTRSSAPIVRTESLQTEDLVLGRPTRTVFDLGGGSRKPVATVGHANRLQRRGTGGGPVRRLCDTELTQPSAATDDQ